MDELSDDRLKEILGEAHRMAIGSDTPLLWSVVTGLEQVGGTSEAVHKLSSALAYDSRVDGDGPPYAAAMAVGGAEFPAPLSSLDEAVLDLWARAVDVAPDGLVRARYADLLWETRHGARPIDWATRAIDAYLAARDEGFTAFEVGVGLRRAVGLARQINDLARQERTIEAALSFARARLDLGAGEPGVVLPLLGDLAGLKRNLRPDGLSEVVDRAVEAYAGDPFLLESTIDVQTPLLDQAERPAAWRRQAEAFGAQARAAEGVVKYHHYQRAIELAELHGLADLAESYRREVEQLTSEDLDLKLITASMEIPREQLEAMVNSIVGSDDVSAALARFGLHLPTRKIEENRERVRQMIADHPLQFLATRVSIGPENSLQRRSEPDSDPTEQALIEHEALLSSMLAVLAVDILAGMRDAYGDLAGARDVFVTPIIEESVADRVANAIRLYELGEFDASAGVLAPRIERIVRKLASAVGLTITRSPGRDGRPGGVKQLGELLSQLEGSVPEEVRRYLRVALTDVSGLNLRNRVGHGLIDEASSQDAALLIHVVCVLRLLRVGPSDDAGARDEE